MQYLHSSAISSNAVGSLMGLAREIDNWHLYRFKFEIAFNLYVIM